MVQLPASRVLFDACGTAHHQARAKQLHRIDPGRLGRPQQWGMQLQRRIGHNMAAVALVNKLVRVCWVVWRTDTPYPPCYGA
ncbi:MAG: hypothetical protein KDI22_06260 [Gammaproteobacteria bacterium]|nr:hypothetical protein [Gammaproteobacteria bacterium]MCB1818763.1 hypothetical protein [Gammaproteobacteria bacterium]MCP5317940.1 hypothetical protein [Chromatiaceae bacterium]MCP5435462.1 hypothetical protein [Chromatiaceae bacterium]